MPWASSQTAQRGDDGDRHCVTAVPLQAGGSRSTTSRSPATRARRGWRPAARRRRRRGARASWARRASR
eukprot:5078570-Pyramimonas_sp.AAC.1